jgi:hypothetical protein
MMFYDQDSPQVKILHRFLLNSEMLRIARIKKTGDQFDQDRTSPRARPAHSGYCIPPMERAGPYVSVTISSQSRSSYFVIQFMA